jgi:predicted N-acetyltransferase YhbS
MPLFADYEPERHGEPSPAGTAIRVATDDDVAAYAALRLERGDATEAEAVSVFRRLLLRARAGEARVLVAAVGERVVAYGAAERLALPTLPAGWYLGGVVVTSEMRRRGIGARLTRERLAWIAERDPRAYYFVNERNRASIDLHAAFGFREAMRDLRVPGMTFQGGVGLLFEADLPPRA